MKVLRQMMVALSALVLLACGPLPGTSSDVYVNDILTSPQNYTGKTVTVLGDYISRDGSAVLALGTSTLDNGQDARPLAEPIWLEGFPEEQVKERLHQPGDAIYGLVRVTGTFEQGQYGPDNAYRYRIQVASAEALDNVRRSEVRIAQQNLGDGKVSLFDLTGEQASQYNGQTITTQGYYFWNGPLAVLAEGVSTEPDGASPQPIGRQIWIEGFPPDKSAELTIGPNNSFVWGKVEVTGQFQSGGQFGANGRFPQLMQNLQAVQAIP